MFCIKALSFLTICSAMLSSVDLSNHPVLNELELADYTDNTDRNHTDILVGSDFYQSLMTGEIVHTESGPTAVCSKFGWLVSGPVGSFGTRELTHTNLVVSYFSEPSSTESHDDHLVTTLKKFWVVRALALKKKIKSVFR